MEVGWLYWLAGGWSEVASWLARPTRLYFVVDDATQVNFKLHDSFASSAGGVNRGVEKHPFEVRLHRHEKPCGCLPHRASGCCSCCCDIHLGVA